MRLILLLTTVIITEAGLFDIFGGKKKEEIHLIRPDPGELGRNIGNANLGSEVKLESGPRNFNEGLEIIIPKNGRPRTTLTTTTVRTTTRSEVTRVLKSDDRHVQSMDCPKRVDAFTPGPQDSFLFDGNRVYVVNNDRIMSSSSISSIFIGGPSTVNAAVYDQDKELIILFLERTVYGFKYLGSNRFELDHTYPKELPDSIGFSPSAAIRWHDGHQMLLSSGGKFALYDEYWNKSLMTGRISEYFEGLPDRVRGISAWSDKKSSIYTTSLVFNYDGNEKQITGEGLALSRHLNC